jgi:hypothetical protein
MSIKQTIDALEGRAKVRQIKALKRMLRTMNRLQEFNIYYQIEFPVPFKKELDNLTKSLHFYLKSIKAIS